MEVKYLRALLMAAPHFLGGRSNVEMEISKALEIDCPLKMESLRACAIRHDFILHDLWPWLNSIDLWPWLEEMQYAALERASQKGNSNE